MDKQRLIDKFKKKEYVDKILELKNLEYWVRAAENSGNIIDKSVIPKLSEKHKKMLVEHVFTKDDLIKEIYNIIGIPTKINFHFVFDYKIQNFAIYLMAMFLDIDILHIHMKEFGSQQHLTYIFGDTLYMEMKHPIYCNEDRIIPYCKIDEEKKTILVNYV